MTGSKFRGDFPVQVVFPGGSGGNSIYTKIGNREVRTGNNYHRTAEPNNWNSDTFLAYILGAVTD